MRSIFAARLILSTLAAVTFFASSSIASARHQRVLAPTSYSLFDLAPSGVSETRRSRHASPHRLRERRVAHHVERMRLASIEPMPIDLSFTGHILDSCADRGDCFYMKRMLSPMGDIARRAVPDILSEPLLGHEIAAEREKSLWDVDLAAGPITVINGCHPKMQIRIATEYAPNFQVLLCLIYAGGHDVWSNDTAGQAWGHIPDSKHHCGCAMDILQTDRNVTARFMYHLEKTVVRFASFHRHMLNPVTVAGLCDGKFFGDAGHIEVCGKNGAVNARHFAMWKGASPTRYAKTGAGRHNVAYGGTRARYASSEAAPHYQSFSY